MSSAKKKVDIILSDNYRIQLFFLSSDDTWGAVSVVTAGGQLPDKIMGLRCSWLRSAKTSRTCESRRTESISNIDSQFASPNCSISNGGTKKSLKA